MSEQKKANDLQEAYRNFDPGKVLEVDSPFYVQPIENNTLPMHQELILSDVEQPIKWFFMGHRGCGKSTLLKRIISLEDVEQKYYIVSFKIPDIVDLNDIGYQDIIFAMASELIDRAENDDILNDQLRKEFVQWGRTLVEESEKVNEIGAEAEGGASAFFAKFMLKLKTQYSTKVMIRKQFEPKIGDLIEIFNKISRKVNSETGKPVLIVIDDIDKVTPEAAKNIFGTNLVTMKSPDCFCIYTIPVSLMHADVWYSLMEHHWYMPNIKLHSKKNRASTDIHGRAKMIEFLEKRMNTSMMQAQAVERCIVYGGGVFRQTCKIVQRAIVYCLTAKRLQVTLEDIDKSISEYANGTMPQLDLDDMSVLSDIYDNNEAMVAYNHPQLLFNMTALIYPDNINWTDVNPVLWSRVEEYVSSGRNKKSN